MLWCIEREDSGMPLKYRVLCKYYTWLSKAIDRYDAVHRRWGGNVEDHWNNVASYLDREEAKHAKKTKG